MKDILDLVQQTLDSVLAEDNVRSYWGRRDDDPDAKTSEYIIYTFRGDSADVSADGDVMYRMMTVELQYYVRFRIARTYAGRLKAADRMDALREAMRAAGFGCPAGWVEIGDVDEVGFATFVSSYDIPRLMDGE